MLGVFGGSFDPIHHGHLIVARAAMETLGLTQVLFVPARAQPLKRGHGAGAEDRAAMVAAAIAGEPRFALESMELRRSGASYTVDTLRALAARLPDERLVLLLGADAAAELPRWHAPEAIRQLARVVVMTRAGTAPTVPDGLEQVQVPAVEISATAIRARVRAGLPIRWLVPDAVATMIAARGLYLTQDDVDR